MRWEWHFCRWWRDYCRLVSGVIPYCHVILELVLFRAIPHRDCKPLAKTLLVRFGSFAEVISASRERLREVGGLSDAAIAELKIVQAAAGRLARGELKARHVLSS